MSKVLQVVLVAFCAWGLPVEQPKGEDPQQIREQVSQLTDLTKDEQLLGQPEKMEQKVENTPEKLERKVRQFGYDPDYQEWYDEWYEH